MLHELNRILSSGDITSLYQPIIDKYTGEIFAYEALSRGPSDSPLHAPSRLFESARQYNLLSEIESLCRERAATGFVQQKLPGKLFINITPESLEQVSHVKGKTLKLMENLALDSSQVVIELTEQFPSTDEALLLKALKYYQEMGLSIALDDLGAGYSSLRLWSKSKPEFVKIDRHFIQDIDLDVTKQEFVRSFVEIAKSMHCKVIAEGVETESEFQYLSKLSIDFFQGYYFCRPQSKPPKELNLAQLIDKTQMATNRIAATAKSLSVHQVSVSSDDKVEHIANIFKDKPYINSIAVLQANKVLGLVTRAKVQGLLSQRFGVDLYLNKKVSEAALESFPLKVDASLSIEQVSRLVTSRARYQQEDDFVILQDDEFVGIGQVIDLLKQVTEQQVNQARYANPLTQLPGLIPINDCIDQLVANNNRFVVVHYDIDNFKPYNDVYGFAKGDEVILALGLSLQKFSNIRKDTIGHIGGDDFIAIFNSDNWQQCIEDAAKHFFEAVNDLYYQQHVAAGGFNSKDRYGVDRFHPLASLSVAAIEVSEEEELSHFDISRKLSPLKHAAKSYTGYSLVIDDVANYSALRVD